MALIVGVPGEETVLIGAFQRPCEVAPVGLPIRRRASGGAAARLGPGTVFLQLAAEDVAGEKILNLQVRPLLRALTRIAGRPVSYFGRDWIACGGRPVGMVAFAHEARTGRSVFEAFVSARTSVWVGERASHRGKAVGTLEVDPSRVVEAVTAAYGGDAEVRELETTVPADEPPWEATREEAIGIVAAGRDAQGVLRIGGELMASCDAVARLEEAIADPHVDVGAAVDAALAAPGVVTFGVRSLSSIRDVVLEVRSRPAARSST